MSEIPGKKAHHSWVTDECRASRGDEAAGREAVDRVFEEYKACLQSQWPAGTRFHFALFVERPSTSLAGPHFIGAVDG